MTGQTFSFLTVLEFNGLNKHRMATWKCRCVCGNITIVNRGALIAGNTKSCGCKMRELHTTHGHCGGNTPDGSATYACWRAMKHRCLNPANKHYKDYGGRGISVCDRWLSSFENFLQDMGVKPDGMSIDRIKNEFGYYKENCQWVRLVDQQSNRRNNVHITINGETKTIAQWAKLKGMSRGVVGIRYRRGWPIDELFLPVKNKFPTISLSGHQR